MVPVKILGVPLTVGVAGVIVPVCVNVIVGVGVVLLRWGANESAIKPKQ
jgi:hypothetical protein